jgi:hypothetical protein
MPDKSGPRKKVALVSVLGTACIAAGIAWAAWNVGGSGSGYAKAGSASALTLGDATGSTTADLYPGATGSVKVSITNPNSFPVRVTDVTGNGTITSDKGAACNAATGVAFANQTGLTLDLAAGATSTFTLGSAVTMSNSSDNSCQGAVFTIPVSVSGTSNALTDVRRVRPAASSFSARRSAHSRCRQWRSARSACGPTSPIRRGSQGFGSLGRQRASSRVFRPP